MYNTRSILLVCILIFLSNVLFAQEFELTPKAIKQSYILSQSKAELLNLKEQLNMQNMALLKTTEDYKKKNRDV